MIAVLSALALLIVCIAAACSGIEKSSGDRTDGGAASAETESKEGSGVLADTAEGEPADSSGTTGGSDASSGSGSSGVSDQSGISGQSGGAGSSSSESSGSSDGNAASGSAGSSGSSHVHDWAAQTTTVHHAPVYKTIHHDAVMEERHICNGCGADITGSESAHIKENILNGCGGWHNAYVTVQEAYDEQVLVSEGWDETVITGYKCSVCGVYK